MRVLPPKKDQKSDQEEREPPPQGPGGVPPGKLAYQMSENVFKLLKEFKFADCSSSADSAGSAAVGSPVEMAGGNEDIKSKMAKTSKPFFNVCHDEVLQNFRSTCQHAFNKLIVQGGENYYLLPESIYDEASKMEEGFESENGKKESKDARMAKISKFYTKALSSLSQQILGMLVPGQVEMISRQQEVEEKVSTNMSSINKTLEAILAKFEFYAAENKSLIENLKKSVKAQKDLETKVDSYRSEIEKLCQESCLSDFSQQNFVFLH